MKEANKGLYSLKITRPTWLYEEPLPVLKNLKKEINDDSTTQEFKSTEKKKPPSFYMHQE